MEELKMKLEMERIELENAISTFNRKAEVLGLPMLSMNKDVDKDFSYLEKTEFMELHECSDILGMLGFTKISTYKFINTDYNKMADVTRANYCYSIKIY